MLYYIVVGNYYFPIIIILSSIMNIRHLTECNYF